MKALLSASLAAWAMAACAGTSALVTASVQAAESPSPAVAATHPGRAHTAVLGSSMGGLIAVYALSEHPQVFGSAAGLSTHWVGGFQPNAALPLAAFEYLRGHRRAADGQRRLCMDHGNTGLDAIYAPYQAFVDEIVRERGYTARDSASRVFAGTGHNERAWAERVHLAIEFLLGGR